MSKKQLQDPVLSAFRILQAAFVIVPILAGIDKFFNVLVEWTIYLAPAAVEMIYFPGFMMAVGIVEIIVGLGIAFRPKIFSYVVAIWLLLVIINLLLTGVYFDLALRDFGLMMAAFALAKLSRQCCK